MKKIILLFTVLMMSLSIMAQSSNKVVTVTADTLGASETVYFNVQPLTGTYTSLALSVVFTEISGTSDGTGYLQGSIDGNNFYNITSETGKATFYPGDTLTITDGAVWLIQLNDPAFVVYRWKFVGTAGDVTYVEPSYIYKR